MKDFRKYDIPFVGLKLGEHPFFYKLDQSFFELFEDSMIQDAQIDLNLVFDKKPGFFDIQFNLSGFLKADCDRCAEEFHLPIENRYRVIVKFNEGLVKPSSENEEILWLSQGDTHINIANHAYEFAVLSLPMQRVHPEKPNGEPGCSIIAILNPESSEAEDEMDQAVDPRWEALKKLKKK